MIPFFWVFLAEVCLLSLLTTHSSSSFLKLLYWLTKSEKAATILFALLFFPGTFVHELAHWLMAKVLLVQTSGMEFLPQVQGDSIKLGSVSIQKTDPVRRLLIGVAPVVAGLTLILGGLGLLHAYFDYLSFSWWVWPVLGYLVFVTASTMFSSRKDLEGAVGVLAALGVIGAALWFFGFDWLLLESVKFLTVNFNAFFKQVTWLMLVPLGINGIICLASLASQKNLT